MSAAGAGTMLPHGVITGAPPSLPPTDSLPVLPLTSTSEVFIPGRGRGFMKFIFDFPEPAVEFEGYRFGFLVFTRENTYGLDAGRITARRTGDDLEITCSGLVPQVTSGGSLAASNLISRSKCAS